MSFRRYGGLNYAPKNNIMASNYNNINNLSVSQAVGQPNSYINFLSDISGNININGDFDISGNLHVAGNIDCSGNENIYGNLYVAGNIDCSGNSTANYMFLTSGTNYTTSPNGVVPKSYVDTIGSGIRPLPLSNLISNNGPITLSGNQTIDGVQTVNGTVVLVNAQDGSGNPSINNGIYIASSGAWSRADYLTTGDDAAGTITFINNGTQYANTRWFCVSPSPAIIGTNMVLWSQYDAPFKLGRGLQLVTIDNAPTIQVDSSLNFIQYLDNTAGPSPGTMNIGTSTTNINIGNTLSTNTINGYTSIDGSSNSTENNPIFQINNNTNNISTVLKINPGLFRNDPSSNYVTYEANDLLNGGACTHYFWDDVLLGLNLKVVGNVGIGTTTPTAPLQIQGASGSSGGPPLLKLVNNTVQYQGGQSNIEFWNNNSGYRLGKISAIDTAPNDTYRSALALSASYHTDGFVEGMRIVAQSASLAFVGIGTTTPTSPLDIKGTLTIRNSTDSVFAALTTGIGNLLTIEAFNGGNTIKYPVCLAAFGGNVGIGTTIPASTLDVNGGLTVRGLAVASGTIQRGTATTGSTGIDGEVGIVFSPPMLTSNISVCANADTSDSPYTAYSMITVTIKDVTINGCTLRACLKDGRNGQTGGGLFNGPVYWIAMCS